MSAMTSALIVTLVGALASTAALVGPPSLPPESGAESDRDSDRTDEDVEASSRESKTDPPDDADGSEGERDGQSSEQPPPPVRSALPPGLAPVPFPLENQRHGPAPTSEDDGAPPPAQERRSIVDLRDPFNRPPPRPRGDGERDATVRLLMPDLKDPFAPGVRRVRSKTLDLRVPNDIRDPFRSPTQAGGPPACVKTTSDGTVVQAPGKKGIPKGECQPSRFDLRDPFDRDPNR